MVQFDTTEQERPSLPGYRLSKMEIYNWGTFDKAVYAFQPNGENTLLVGENGSGKSTLVDALLTLLVRPQTRNYNVAAGANKNERDERTYIRGAYDRIVGDSGRPQIQFLRPDNKHYTALLACFENQQTRSQFTVCQILYLAADNSVEKIYAFSEGSRSIIEDLSGLKTTAGVAKYLRERGFNTSTSYRQYFARLQKVTNCRDKAMEVFNQTVAVKDVQCLDQFIRQHMLEARPWKEKVDRLLSHFGELSEAHRMLVQVRIQEELLRPIVELAKNYDQKKRQAAEAERLASLCDVYFAQRSVELLEPLCETWQQEIAKVAKQIIELGALESEQRDKVARLNIEIENESGDRLRQIPGRIKQLESSLSSKKALRQRFEKHLRQANLETKITSPDQFHFAQKELNQHNIQLQAERQQLRELEDQLASKSSRSMAALSRDQAELSSVSDSGNNMPSSLVELRARLCSDLGIDRSNLPFAGELMCVAEDESHWEASIEQVLYGFARSLLVPSDLYQEVSSYIEANRLVDSRGRGQRLVYLRVNPTQLSKPKSSVHGTRLVEKLIFHAEAPLSEWVKAEVESKFNYQACETVEQFQRAKSAAMTQNCHFKSNAIRHEKNDRPQTADQRSHVLGWENQARRQDLSQHIKALQQELEEIESKQVELGERRTALSKMESAIEAASLVTDFETINYEQEQLRLEQLRKEHAQLSSANNQLELLQQLRDQTIAEAEGYRLDRDNLIARRTTLESELASGQRVIENAQKLLAKLPEEVELETRQRETDFERIDSSLPAPLTAENLALMPREVTEQFKQKFESLRDRLQPIAREITSAMTRFLKRFPDAQADLDAHVESLPSFQLLYEKIAADELPQYEQRFKQRLNEKVLHEVGMLNSNFESERQDIKEKIWQLNTALKLLNWQPDSTMQLEATETTDREIQDFRKELASCLSQGLSGDDQLDETTFLRIEKLITKFRSEGTDRWRAKVTDVRNWFNFAAREIVKETGESRSYYDGGTGQSGGEKGKLAFLVLVAAIAYQYDLDPDAETSNRFHFVMVDEMFSRSDDQHAEYALDLFDRFGLQLLIVAPLDAKARVTEPYVGNYVHVVKNKRTHCSELLSISADKIVANELQTESLQ